MSSISKFAENIFELASALRNYVPMHQYGPGLLGMLLVGRLQPEGLAAVAEGVWRSTCSDALVEVLDNFGFRDFVGRVDNTTLATLAGKIEQLDLPSLGTGDMLELYDDVLSRFTDNWVRTPTGVNQLLVGLLTSASLDGPQVIYDPACGVGGLLQAAQASLGTAAVHGTDVNQSAAALTRSRSLLLGEPFWKILTSCSLADDPHHGVRASHLVCNPPFGMSWAQLAKAVQGEAGEHGRFRLGLPRRSDSALLFLQDLLAKMRPPAQGGARVVFLSSGSPLWSGSPGSGESEIRRHLFETDLVESILVLPVDLLPHTTIQTYAWVLTNCKQSSKRGFVRLIDGSEFFTASRSRHPKHRLDADNINALLGLLEADEGDLVRLVPNSGFGYKQVLVRSLDKASGASRARSLEIGLNEDVEEHLRERSISSDEVQDVAVGYAVQRIAHLGFGLSRELTKLGAQYKTCSIRPMEDICLEIQRLKPARGQPALPRDSALSNLPLLRAIQIEPDPEIITSDYLAMFFATDLGRRLLDALGQATTALRIDPKDLGKLSVPVPTLEEQESILATKRRIDELTSVLARVEAELAANPSSVAEVNDRVVPMLQGLGRLSQGDEVKERVRAGESKRVEFKETFLMDIRKGEKAEYVEVAALKTIVAFLNSDGGDLLLGVADDGSIPGLSKEIDAYFKGDTDRYLLHVKNRLKQRIGEQFYPLIDQRLVTVGGQVVLWVACSASEQPVFLDEKMFFVRTNPATDELTGRKMVEYIRIRFAESSVVRSV